MLQLISSFMLSRVCAGVAAALFIPLVLCCAWRAAKHAPLGDAPRPGDGRTAQLQTTPGAKVDWSELRFVVHELCADLRLGPDDAMRENLLNCGMAGLNAHRRTCHRKIRQLEDAAMVRSASRVQTHPPPPPTLSCQEEVVRAMHARCDKWERPELKPGLSASALRAKAEHFSRRLSLGR